MVNYSFLTVWKFDAPIEKVYNAIHDSTTYHLWWKGQSPVKSVKSGDTLGVGAVRQFKTRSVLPYNLTYTGTVLEVMPQQKIVGTTVGELIGRGEWTFENKNGITTVNYLWNVKTNSVVMNLLAPVLKPLFEWNHDVVMKWGGEGLAKYLDCQIMENRSSAV